MKSLIELLKWISENWASIVLVITLCLGIYNKILDFVYDYKNKTEEEKQREFEKAVSVAKRSLADYILLYVSEAEKDWNSVDGKLGETKRAQVISKVYETYPVLEEVTDKKQLLKYIDYLIDESLKIVKKELGK